VHHSRRSTRTDPSPERALKAFCKSSRASRRDENGKTKNHTAQSAFIRRIMLFKEVQLPKADSISARDFRENTKIPLRQ
jgi:hypothetical protein